MNNKDKVKKYLDGAIGEIYKSTLDSCLNRIEEDGFYPESLTGRYVGEFIRTIGAFVKLCLEVSEHEKAKRAMRYVFDCKRKFKLSRFPHVIEKKVSDGKAITRIDALDQPDGRLHLILGFALYCLETNDTSFENEYYDDIREEFLKIFDYPYFYYLEEHYNGPYRIAGCELCLLHNPMLEHSREFRLWQAFDILTQSFLGAASEKMHKLAKRRQDSALIEWIDERIPKFKLSIDKYMTRIVYSRKVYLEMRLPDSNFGKPYLGMSWLNLAPVAAEWQALDPWVLNDTIELMEKKLWVLDPVTKKMHLLLCEYDEEGNPSHQIFGKHMAWHIDYCASNQDWGKIASWFDFIAYHHKESSILMEQMNLVNGEWEIGDAGNGEQCVWWCWAIARLIKYHFTE